MKCKGQPGARIWKTGGNFNIRRHEREAAEQERQARFADSVVGADGGHYTKQEYAETPWGPDTPSYRCSLEEQERRTDKLVFWKVKGGLWKSFWDGAFAAGMYSSDPQIARIGMIQTARREVDKQREITATAQNEDLVNARQVALFQQTMAAQREADELAGEKRRAQLIAKAIVDEMEARRVI